jgi:hypothetical protein
MGKHETSYARVERDLYPTPAWVIAALAEHLHLRGRRVWEPAAGNGQMTEALRAAGAQVYATDIADHGYAGLDLVLDFLSGERPTDFDGIVTNPPFGPRGTLAEKFIATGLRHLIEIGSLLALLLPADFDSARTRSGLFGGCPHFVGKITLTRRVKWFEHEDKPNVTPKENSAWFIWSRAVLRCGQPVILYAPTNHQQQGGAL